LGEPAAPPEKRHPKRQRLPPSLARIDEHLEPASARCPCGAEMSRIGEDIAETLEIIPSKFYVRRRIRGRWVCRCREQLTMAPVLEPGTGRTATGYLWAYRTLPTVALQAVVFDFGMNRGKERPPAHAG